MEQEHPDILLLRQHLVQHLGSPDELTELRGNPNKDAAVQVLHIAKFKPLGPEAPVAFATSGACIQTTSNGLRVEALMIFRKEPPAEVHANIHHLLGSFVSYLSSPDLTLGVGSIISATEELKHFSSAEMLLVLPPVTFPESFHRVALRDESSAELFWLMPIYANEANYAAQYGANFLLMLCALQSLDLLDPYRASADTSILPEQVQSEAEAQAQAIAAMLEAQSSNAPVKLGSHDLGRKPKAPPSHKTSSYQATDAGEEIVIVRKPKEPKAQSKEQKTPTAKELSPTPGTNKPVSSNIAAPLKIDINKGKFVSVAKTEPVPSSEVKTPNKENRIAELREKAKARLEKAQKNKDED